MSQHCQFCDKEMILEGSVVHVKGYITCGATPCTEKARSNSEYHAKAAYDKEQPSTTTSRIAVFQTTNPYSPSSWKIVHPADHPDFMGDPEIVARMLDGDIVNKLKVNKSGMIYYRAEKVKNIRKQLGDILNA